MEYGQMMEQAKENAKLAFYQNPGYQLERRERKSFIIKVLGMFSDNKKAVFEISQHMRLTTYHHAGYATNAIDKSAFVLKIDEFNHQGNSTDSNTFNKLIIPNEHAGATGATSRKIHKGKKLNYIASINPITLTNIIGTITDLGGGAMFNDDSDMFLAEFVIIARD